MERTGRAGSSMMGPEKKRMPRKRSGSALGLDEDATRSGAEGRGRNSRITVHPHISNPLPSISIDTASRKRRGTPLIRPLIELGAKTSDFHFELLNPPASKKSKR